MLSHCFASATITVNSKCKSKGQATCRQDNEEATSVGVTLDSIVRDNERLVFAHTRSNVRCVHPGCHIETCRSYLTDKTMAVHYRKHHSEAPKFKIVLPSNTMLWSLRPVHQENPEADVFNLDEMEESEQQDAHVDY